MKATLQKLVDGQTLNTQETVDCFNYLMSGDASPAQWGAVLAMMQLRKPTIEEITGAATVMREKSVKVQVPQGLTAIDTCGTGGDHAGTFNISTGAAIVAAAAGRPFNVAVAKHGNRSVTSKSGSSQVLETLGVKLKVTGETMTRCLDEAGLCFCFAPAHHPAMKYAVPVRQDLGFRTIFNMLGPLTNPAGAQHQVMGVFSADLTEPIANVLAKLGSKHAMVVHGQFGSGSIDELSTAGPTQISEVRDGRVTTWKVTTDELNKLGVYLEDTAQLQVDSPDASASTLTSIIEGTKGPARDIVCLNAAAALVVAQVSKDLEEGVAQAQEAIDTGKAKAALATLVAITQADES